MASLLGVGRAGSSDNLMREHEPKRQHIGEESLETTSGLELLLFAAERFDSAHSNSIVLLNVTEQALKILRDQASCFQSLIELGCENQTVSSKLTCSTLRGIDITKDALEQSVSAIQAFAETFPNLASLSPKLVEVKQSLETLRIDPRFNLGRTQQISASDITTVANTLLMPIQELIDTAFQATEFIKGNLSTDPAPATPAPLAIAPSTHDSL